MDQRLSLISEKSGQSIYFSADDDSDEDRTDAGEDVDLSMHTSNTAELSGVLDTTEMRNIRASVSPSRSAGVRMSHPVTTGFWGLGEASSGHRGSDQICPDHLLSSDIDLRNLRVDSAYKTVTSIESCDSIDVEDDVYSPSIYGELIKFAEDNKDSEKCRPNICTCVDTPVDDIAQYMAMSSSWKMRTPKVILSIVSGVKHSTVFQNAQYIEHFQKGLIKAANTTSMWILTDGVDFGVPKIVGDAVAEEVAWRKMLQSDCMIRNADKLPKLTVIGILLREMVRHDRRGSNDSFTKYQGLNTDHTHYIMAEGSSGRMGWVRFRDELEARFLQPVGRPRKYRRVTINSESHEIVDHQNHFTPLVAILLQGGVEEVEHTLSLLKRRNPVIVIKGSGYAADLIAFAYEGVRERPDPEYVSTYIKPELMRKVGQTFLEELQDNHVLITTCRDNILECLEYAQQDDQTFLTVVDVTSWDTDLRDISKYILLALFRSEKRMVGKQLLEQILRGLQLTLDWNLSDLAKTAIFEKYAWKRFKIEDYLFEEALLRRDREEFVDLFLKHGFRVHTYLNHKKLQYLFENAEDKDLFFRVCLESVLGKIVEPTGMEKTFLEGDSCQLNRLLFKCTDLRNIVSPYELSMNCVGSYITDVEVAERKAMNTLVLWSALTHKIKLTKLLWQKVDDPIPMALIVSTLFHRLAKFCADRDLRSQLKQHAIEFGTMAVDLFDLSYIDSPAQALGILSKRLPDYDNRTVMEIAYMGRNRFFISHKCCQRWLNQRWYGHLTVREVDWGLFSLPHWLKIYLCAFLVFPMFIWLSFTPKPKDTQKMEEGLEREEDDTEKEKEDQAYLMEHLGSIELKHRNQRKKSFSLGIERVKLAMSGNRRKLSLPVLRQIFYLWSAPITKFWIAQLFYLLYLGLFTVALILPTCGNLYLDLAVFTWTLVILVELCRFTHIKKQRYPEMSIGTPSLEIILILLFLGFYLFVRIIPHFVVLTGINYEFTDYQSAKFVMSVGLLYFYYRLLTTFLPISPTLGPMLINIRRMVQDDFSTWFRMFLVFMVAGAITIQAVIYPNHEFSIEMLRKAFARALFALFLTKIDDLEGDQNCHEAYPNATLGFCGQKYKEPHLTPCAYGAGFANYVIVIQYLLIVKLVLTTLLFAMFSTTISQISSESNQIWKFQRYSLIVEFEERLRLPAPLTVFSYISMFMEALWWQCLSLRTMCLKCCRGAANIDRVDSMRHAKIQGIVHIKRTEDFNYWKKCVKEYSSKEDKAAVERDRGRSDSHCLRSLIEDMDSQKHHNRRLNDRLVHLEKGLTSCLMLMEETKHLIEKIDPLAQGITSSQKQQVHLYSRQSPYPDTAVERYPVFDKFVSWEVVYSTYDPAIYTKPLTEFPIEQRKFVDKDTLMSASPSAGSDVGVDEFTDQSEKSVRLRPRWNAVCTMRAGSTLIEVDRTSWISEGGRTCRYKLDRTNVPQNPQGRTGIRGRGSLWRWGPNHSILAVVSRCKAIQEEGKPWEQILVDGRKVLEFITVQSAISEEFVLPGGIIHGETSPYSLLCEQFMRDVLDEEVVDGRVKLDKEDMVHFFSQFAIESGTLASGSGSGMDSDAAESGLTAEILYRGYLDDPLNTDNAWMETEVWNFHFEDREALSSRSLHATCKWQDVCSHTRLHRNQLDIILEAAKNHNAHH